LGLWHVKIDSLVASGTSLCKALPVHQRKSN
jgi:hypothetical protein